MTIGLWWCPFHSDAIRLRVGRCIVWLYISCWNNYSNMSEMLNATDDIKKDGLSLSTGKLVPNKENGLFSYCWFTSPQKCQNQHSWIMHTLVSSSKKILTHTHTHTHTRCSITPCKPLLGRSTPKLPSMLFAAWPAWIQRAWCRSLNQAGIHGKCGQKWIESTKIPGGFSGINELCLGRFTSFFHPFEHQVVHLHGIQIDIAGNQ